MTLQEFTECTGFYPDDTLYGVIEMYYTLFIGDKDAFYKAYKENVGGLAEKIQQEANNALDKMLEWKPCDDYGTNMSQEQYDELLEHCTGMDGEPNLISEEEAKKLLADEFGFSPDKIEIVYTVHTYEANRRRERRKDAEYKRLPLYDSSDYNYVRFNVKCTSATWCYEMINGQLKEYCC